MTRIASSIVLTVLVSMSLAPTRATAQLPYSAARYVAEIGSLYVYQTSGIALIGFNSDGLFNYSNGLPTLGNVQADIANESAFGIFRVSGLPAGLFNLGSVLPTGLTSDDITFTYDFIGSPTINNPDVEAGPNNAAASAKYNSATGAVTVNIAPAAQGLLLESPGLFNIGATPKLGTLAPSQFDAKNLMFFNNDAPLPAGTFNLGAVLPPGLTASQISLATKGDGIAAGIPVTVVPEPTAATLALATVLAGLARAFGRRDK